VTEGLNTWLITGSSRGFGAELVLATARRPEDIKQPQEEYRELFRTAPLDVTDPRAAEAAVALAVAEFGSLAVVVNDAGYANSASIEEMGPKDFKAQIEANPFGVVNVTRAALPILRGQRFGTFVQFSSVGGRVGGTPGMGAYQTGADLLEGPQAALGINPPA
jgi:NAD(P)-dependent dehydrogenase (short-subunit alcohol dehydrogenase family)